MSSYAIGEANDDVPDDPGHHCCGQTLGINKGFRICDQCGSTRQIKIDPFSEFQYQSTFFSKQTLSQGQVYLLELILCLWDGQPLSTREIHNNRKDMNIKARFAENKTRNHLECLQYTLPTFPAEQLEWRLRLSTSGWTIWSKHGWNK